MPESFEDDLKKMIMLGIGAAAEAVEKSKDIIGKLVKKGELTIEQGKVFNEELKHNIKEALKKNPFLNTDKNIPIDKLINDLDKFSEDELAALREKLDQMEAEKQGNK